MKTLSIIVLVAHLFSLGCSHVHAVQANDPVQLAGPNSLGQGSTTLLVLRDGQAFTAHDLFVTSDATSWRDAVTRQSRRVQTTSIEYIQGHKHGQGALEGLFKGLLIGGIPGALLGFATGGDPPSWSSWESRQGAAILGVACGGVCGMIGLIAGTIKGSTITYRMEG